mgnify:CR=1 FL=1
MADKEKKQAAVKSKSHKKKIKKAIISIILIGCITVIVVFNVNNKKDDTKTATVTKENTAKKGNLTVGITESGTMEIGSITQSYELDTSSVGSSSSSSSSSSGSSSLSSSSSGSSNKSDTQGMQNMGGAMGMAGGQSGSDSSSSTTKTTSSSSGNESVSDSDLVIKKVCITSGQNVKKGDTILKLTTKSVSNVRKLYKAAVSSAKLSLKEAKVDRDSDKLTAEYEYKERIAAGKRAKTTYKATLQSLDSAVVTAQNNYNTAVSGIKTLPSKIKNLKKKIKKAGGSTTVYKSTSTNQNTGSNAGNNTGNMNGTGMGDDKNGGTSGTGTTAGSTGSQSSSNTVTIMQQQLASYQQQLSEYKSNLKNLKSQLKSAKKARKTGKVSAKKTYDAAMLQYSNAKTLYNVAMDGIDDDVKDAQETLKDAQKALKTFEKYAGTGVIKAECSGTVTSVGYEDGETLSTDTDIATYMNSDAVTTSVSVAQDDISEIEVGDTVNISLSAYEGKTFHGKVTSISTTSSGTSTVSYPVVVTMTGDVSSIYAGMSADVTFVTKEVKDVLYISNKAVETEGTKSYVTRKNSDASTTKTQVKTGFSDGHNVQIESGLSEGDTVLIESRVSE